MKNWISWLTLITAALLMTSCGSNSELNVRQMDNFLVSYETAVESLELDELSLQRSEVEDSIIEVNGLSFTFQFDSETDEIAEVCLVLENALVGEDDKGSGLETFIQASELLLKTLHPKIEEDDLEKLLKELHISEGEVALSSKVSRYDGITYAATIVDDHKAVLRALLTAGVEIVEVEDRDITLPLSVGDRNGVYSGDMIDELPDGFGRFDSVNSSGESWHYVGFFRNGHFDGFGRSVWPSSGVTHEGDYKNDKLNGFGKAIGASGNPGYVGEYIDGVYHGKGTIYRINGIPLYEGDFANGVYEGSGVLYTVNAEIAYEGTFSNNKPSDESKFKSSCRNISYTDLSRNPDTYVGVPTRLTGTLIQVLEIAGESDIEYIIAVEGNFNDVMYLTYTRGSDESRALENDNVEVWGIHNGLVSYESISGQTITVPHVDVYYLAIM